MKTKLKTSSELQNQSILENRNFLNNQNYVTIWKNYRLLNYYAFNKFSQRNNKVLIITYKSMKKYFINKLIDLLKISVIFSIFYIWLLIDNIFIFFVWPLILFHFLAIYSFIYFIFNKKNNNFKYHIDWNKFIILKK